MTIAYVTIGVLLSTLALWSQRRQQPHTEVIAAGLRQLRPLLLRLPLALLAGTFLGHLVPHEQVVAILGDASGVQGVLVASALGALLPGGPMVAFPIAIALHTAGMGMPQMVALITAWSVLAVHRVLVFELPMLGWAFVFKRMLVCAVLPVVAGLLAALALTTV